MADREEVKAAVDSAEQLSQEETDVLTLLKEEKVPLSSIAIAYNLKMLPTDVNDTLARLQTEGYVETLPVNDRPISSSEAAPIAKEKGEVFTLSEKGHVTAGVANLLM